MTPIKRSDVNGRTTATLARRQKRVDAATDPSGTAVASWKTFRGAAREDVVATLRQMCRGIERCMYCEDSQGTAVEHFRPKADFPSHAFQWLNYLWACSHCNSNEKRNEFPEKNGSPLLIDPTVDDPYLHIVYSASTGRYVAISEKGAESIRVFGLNREICTRGRRAAWTAMNALIRDYAGGTTTLRSSILATLSDFPFQGVRRWMTLTVAAGDPASVIPEDVKNHLNAYPQLLWP